MDRNVHLLVTNSGMAEMYVYDVLKTRCNASLESVYNISKKSEFMSMLELVNMQPYMADMWLFIIDFNKVKSLVKQYSRLFSIDTSCFLVKCKNYAEFKEFKEIYQGVNDLYLSVIRDMDIKYILKEYKLPDKMIDFVSKSYGRDPEKIFILRKELENGIQISSNKEIVDLCGVGTGSIISFVMLMLADPPKTSSGLARVLKKRIQTANELVGVYGISSFKNFTMSTVKDIYDIKTLYDQGVIYKSIRGLPECYDEKKLSKYNMYLRRLTEELPMSRVVKLYLDLKKSGKWSNKVAMVQFIYDYYGGLCNEIIS